jgi:hypothetical protein
VTLELPAVTLGLFATGFCGWLQELLIATNANQTNASRRPNSHSAQTGLLPCFKCTSISAASDLPDVQKQERRRQQLLAKSLQDVKKRGRERLSSEFTSGDVKTASKKPPEGVPIG